MDARLSFAAALTLCALLIGCDPGEANVASGKPKKQGAHVRIVNATDAPLSFILYPKQLNDHNKPGEANPFQKEPPGPRKLQILTPDKKLLQEFDVELLSGTPSTFIVRGGPKTFEVDRIDNEERLADDGQCKLALTSGYEGPQLPVVVRGPSGELALGLASKLGTEKPHNVPPGSYEILIGGKLVGKGELKPGTSYSVVVRTEKGQPTANILKNSPPEMKIVGVESAASAG